MTWRQMGAVACTSLVAPYIIFTDKHPFNFLKVVDFDLSRNWWKYVLAAALLGVVLSKTTWKSSK